MEQEFVVMPRGGASEVGRACYQVDVGNKRFLVDCGMGQTTPISYPNFQKLDRKSIDGVFLTHAHIDHTGGLPLLEHGGGCPIGRHPLKSYTDKS